MAVSTVYQLGFERRFYYLDFSSHPWPLCKKRTLLEVSFRAITTRFPINYVNLSMKLKTTFLTLGRSIFVE